MTTDAEKGTRFELETAAPYDSHLAPTVTQGTDKEGSSGYANSEAGLAHKSENAKAERKLLFKLGGSELVDIKVLCSCVRS